MKDKVINIKLIEVICLVLLTFVVVFLTSTSIAYFTSLGSENIDLTFATLDIELSGATRKQENAFPNVTIDDLVYVDYETDIMKDGSGNLDLMATYFDVYITNKSNKEIPLDIELEMEFASAHEANTIIVGLISYTTDCPTTYYDTLFAPIYEENDNIADFKEALNENNNATIDGAKLIFNLKNNYSMPLESIIKYRFVLFADYEVATDDSTYPSSFETNIHHFTHSYDFNLKVTAIQTHD